MEEEVAFLWEKQHRCDVECRPQIHQPSGAGGIANQKAVRIVFVMLEKDGISPETGEVEPKEIRRIRNRGAAAISRTRDEFVVSTKKWFRGFSLSWCFFGMYPFSPEFVEE